MSILSMLNIRIALGLVASGAVLLPHNALAQSQSAPAGSETSDDAIIVTASGVAESQRDVALSISRLDRETIANLEAIRIGDVLAEVPGVFFSGLNGPREIAQIRQPLAFDNRTLFLENGVPLQSSIFFDQSALGYSLGLVQPAAIEVLRGPGTALYGSDAFNGVVNIITRMPGETVNGEAQARYGSFGLFDLNGSVGGPLGQGSDHRARLTLAYSGEDGFREETAFDRLQGLLHHRYERGDVAIDCLATYTEYQTESATSISFADFLAGDRSSGLSPLVDPEAAREQGTYARVQSAITYTPAGKVEVTLTPYLRRQEIVATATFQPATTPRTDARVDSFGLLARSLITWSDTAKTTLGLDTELTDFSRLTVQDAPDTVVFGSLFRQGIQFDYDVSYRGLAPYIQHEQTLGRLIVQLGLRYDAIRYDFDNQLVEVPGDARLQLADRLDRFEALSPKAGIVYTLNEQHRLYARYARGFRIPRESDLYELEEGQDNFTLEPEKIDSGEVGWRYADGRVRADLVGYWAVSRDGIITDVQTAAGNISINAGSSRFAGIETAFSADITDSLSVRSSFAFQDFRFIQRASTGDDPFDGNLISEAPRTIGQITASWNPAFHRKLQTQLRLRHIGRWALNDANTLFTDNEFIISGFARYAVTDWMSLDLRIENITDTLYPVFADAPVFAPNGRARPGQPRTVSGGIAFRF
ncbi:MAG: TonB-dependent receptor [Pseudomonadota bacterium]